MATGLRHGPLWLVCWVVGLLLCVALSLGPALLLPAALPQGDKLGHLLAYALLTAWACWVFPGVAARWRAVVAVWVLGVLMEVGQATLTTHRVMDGWDVLANTLGVALGAALGSMPANPLRFIEGQFEGRSR